LGLSYYDLGQFERSAELYKQALFIAREVGDRAEEGVNFCNLGTAYYALGQWEQAVESHKVALSIAREIGYRAGEERYLSNLGKTYLALGLIAEAVRFHRQSLDIALEINDKRGQGHCMLELGKALLNAGQLPEALQYCTEARDLNMSETKHRAVAVRGIVLLQQCSPTAKPAFVDAINCCRAILTKTTGLWQACYTLATALVGQAVCDPRWADESERPDLLAPALAEYRRALDITAAPGIVQEAIRDLELIQAAGIEGLEPAFELLENAEYEPDLPENLPDIIEDLLKEDRE